MTIAPCVRACVCVSGRTNFTEFFYRVYLIVFFNEKMTTHTPCLGFYAAQNVCDALLRVSPSPTHPPPPIIQPT